MTAPGLAGRRASSARVAAKGAIAGPPRPDLRLFGFAGAVWAASIAVLRTGTGPGALLAAASAGLAIAIVLVAVRCGPAAKAASFAVAGVLIGVGCGAAATAARTWLRDAQPLASQVEQRQTVRVEMTVTDDPRRLAPASGQPTYLVRARLTKVESLDGAGVRLSARVILFASDETWRTVLPSQQVATTARLSPPKGGDLTAAVLTATGTPALLGRPSWTQSAAGRLRAGLQAACARLPPEPGGLLPGLVIGDTSRLDPAVAEEFRATGLTHLTAVSGANIAILLGVVLFVARWCRAGPRLSAAVCGLALAGFVILVRPSPSVVRAAAMGAVGLLALVTGRQRSAPPALAVAAVAGLVHDPALAVDPGFVLSVLATGGLILLAPRWRDRLLARGVPRVLAEPIAVSAAAQVVCGPVIAAISGQVSLVAIPANLLAVPVVAPATLLGVGAAVISPLWSDAAEALAWLGSWPARWLVWVADAGAALPMGGLPWPAGLAGGLALAALTITVLIAAGSALARRLLLTVVIAAAVGALPVRWLAFGWPPAGTVMVMCDVGQGDAIVLPAGPTEAVVVDTGPDPGLVDACLRRLGVRTVLLLAISHFHSDHVDGVAGVVRGRQVGGVILPPFTEPEPGERAIRAAIDPGTPVIEARAGWRYTRGGLELTVLGPLEVLTGTRSDPNNNSLVIRAVNGGAGILLAGDAETEQQHTLLAAWGPGLLRAPVLKVPHHGSSYQNQAWLEAVDPVLALVSVGAGNPFGHPSPDLLDHLGRGGARVVRTDIDGDIAVVAQPGVPGGVAVSTSRGSRSRAANRRSGGAAEDRMADNLRHGFRPREPHPSLPAGRRGGRVSDLPPHRRRGGRRDRQLRRSRLAWACLRRPVPQTRAAVCLRARKRRRLGRRR